MILLPHRTPISASIALAALLVAWPPSGLSAADYESAGKVKAADYLPPEALAGMDWEVAEAAENDGAFNTYVVESRFGSFPARGRAKVGIRSREVEALAELERVSKTEVFAEAVKESALGSVETVVELAKNPVETVKAVPGAVSRWFKKTKFAVEETWDDVEEAKEERDRKKAEQEARKASGEVEDSTASKDAQREELEDKAQDAATKAALDYLKISGAERRWYKELGVDPYTDNEPLRAAVKSFSRVEGLTRFGMKFAGIPKIPGASEIRKTMDLVWDVDPWELRLQNRNELLAAGISEETARDFEDNPYLSLTMQTGFLQALEALDGVAGRQHLLERALDVDSKDGGAQLVLTTSLLARHHKGSRPLQEILRGARLPVARSQRGQLLVVIPADALFWTEEIAEAAAGFFSLYADDEATEREIWVVGDASPRFEAEARKAGWDVRDRWQLAAPEDAEPNAG